MAFVIKMTKMQTVELVTLTSVRKLYYSGFTLFQDDAQVKDTCFIFVFALFNSAGPEPGSWNRLVSYGT